MAERKKPKEAPGISDPDVRKADGETHDSFEDTSFGIGQMADGSINIVPLSELGRITAERDSQEAAIAHAIAQSDAGFPDGDGDDDDDDLDDDTSDDDGGDDVDDEDGDE